MKKIFPKILTRWLLFACCIQVTAMAQTIPAHFFGQNAWYTRYTNDGQATNTNDHFSTNITEVKNASPYFIRIGGANANILGNDPGHPLTASEALFLIKKIRDQGLEPIVQVPYLNEDNANSQSVLTDWADKAKKMVDTINNIKVNEIPIGPLGTRKVTYWIIANEPDKHLSGTKKIGYNYNQNDTSSPGKIAKYIKQFAIKMREADPDIKIMGPELSWYIHHFYFGGSYGGKTFKGMLVDNSPNDITGLIGATDVFGSATATSVRYKPYIDYVTFHWYTPSDSIQKVINELHSEADNWKFKKGLINLKNAVNSSSLATKRTTGPTTFPLKVAVTEANTQESTTYNPSTFLAGQWWADFASVCLSQEVDMIQYWSSAENSFGFMNNSGTKRSSYHHFKQMSTNFKGTYYTGTDNKTNIKAFGSRGSNQIAVMILNQDTAVNKPYTIRLDSTQPATATWIKMNMDNAITTAYTDTIIASSTTLLIFDCAGNIVKKYRYEKADLNNPFKQIWHRGSYSIADQFAFNNYPSAVYYNIDIGTISSSISVNTLGPHLFESANDITVRGEFIVPLGETLTLFPTSGDCD